MNNSPKIFQDIKKLRPEQIAEIDVVCFGHFNILHPGHFRFLEFAKNQGDHLCIILKGDDEIADETETHFFPEADRASVLSGISSVGSVLLKGKLSLRECLQILKPKKLVLGNEFRNSDNQQVIGAEGVLDSMGGQVIYHAGDKHVSTLVPFESTLSQREEENRQKFLAVCDRRGIKFDDLNHCIEKFQNLNVLVVGDLIVDKFVSCDTLGVSSEAPVLVVKELEEEDFIGGAGVVASHIAALGANSKFVSVVGDDSLGAKIGARLSARGVSEHLIIDEKRITTEKTRYLVGTQKVFRVSKLMDHNIGAKTEAKIIQHIHNNIKDIDCIIVSDFVYGVVTPKLLEYIQNIAYSNDVKLFGDLQCSSQIGDVSKFQNFDMIFPTEKEARIAIGNKDDGLEFVAQQILRTTNCKNLAVKLGGNGLVVYDNSLSRLGESEHFPALSANPIDVSGAGDSLLSAMALSMTAGANLMQATAIGSLVASCAVEKLGNVPVDGETLGYKMKKILKR